MVLEGKTLGAIEKLENSIKLDPANLETHLLYIKISKMTCPMSIIIGNYRKALQKNHYEVYPHFTLGLAYLFSKSSQDAIKEFSRALKYGPDESLIYYYRAKAYMLQGAKELALRDMRKVLDLEPTNLEFIYILIEFLINLNNIKHAKSLLKVLEKQVPYSPLAICAKARLNIADGDIKEAKSNLKKAGRHGTKYHLYQFLRGKVAQAEGNTKKAIEYYKKALSFKPFWDEAEKEIVDLRESIRCAACTGCTDE